jgi:hypothetical protein
MAAPFSGRPKCMRCVHFFITYDPFFPNGCRAMNFKSRGLPQDEVRSASGSGCLSFLERQLPSAGRADAGEG